MKVFRIECQGSLHQIEIYKNGNIRLLNHDIWEEETLRMMGDDISECYKLAMHLRGNPDGVLFGSAEKGNVPGVDMALRMGADVNANDGYALRIASAFGFVDIVELLLFAGANVSVMGGEVFRVAEYSRDSYVKQLLCQLHDYPACWDQFHAQ